MYKQEEYPISNKHCGKKYKSNYVKKFIQNKISKKEKISSGITQRMDNEFGEGGGFHIPIVLGGIPDQEERRRVIKPESFEYSSQNKVHRLNNIRLLGNGVEAKVYRQSDTAYKVFGIIDKSKRDNEFKALEKIYVKAPGLFPTPFSKGQMKIKGKSGFATYAMEFIPGSRLSGSKKFNRYEVQELYPLLKTLALTIKATGISWDDTPQNIMFSNGRYRFIDPDLHGDGFSSVDDYVTSFFNKFSSDKDSIQHTRSLPNYMNSTESSEKRNEAIASNRLSFKQDKHQYVEKPVWR